MRNLLRLVPAGLLGVGAAILISCGSSGKGLIPLADAGPLQSDFQAVLQAAQEGNGNCAATEAQIRKTERDLAALPSSVDGGLRGRLAEGVTNLSARARVLCAEPLTQTTTTETTTATTPPATTTSTQPTATTTTPTATTPGTGTPSGEEGGTQAPGEEGTGQEAEGNGGGGRGNGLGKGEGGGRDNGRGGAEPEEDGSGEVSGGTGGGK